MALPIPIPAALPEEMCFVWVPFVGPDDTALVKETFSVGVLDEEEEVGLEVFASDEDGLVTELEAVFGMLEAEVGATLVVSRLVVEAISDVPDLGSKPRFSEESIIKHDSRYLLRLLLISRWLLMTRRVLAQVAE